MKVYLVEGFEYESSRIIGVFKNEKYANEVKDLVQKLYDLNRQFRNLETDCLHRFVEGYEKDMERYKKWYTTEDYKKLEKVGKWITDEFDKLGIDDWYDRTAVFSMEVQ